VIRLSGVAGDFGLELVRDGEFENLGFLFDSQPGKLCFLEKSSFRNQALRSRGLSCLLTTRELAPTMSEIPGLAVCANPRRVFFDLHNHLARSGEFYGASFASEIDQGALIHPRAWIAERNVRIRAGCRVGANATIEEGATLGSDVEIGAGVVVGAEGFQSYREGTSMVDMIHAGGVLVETGARILANAVVARAVFHQETVIGENSRIGNLAFISHAVRIGKRCFIAHHATVNGNVEIEDDAWIGPGATIAHNLRIGRDAKVSLGSTVIRDVAAGQRVTGSIALEHRKMLGHWVSLR
jgi:UDP-3-O-[3-hydroxymyristoyl] glucosamine N-acyltransferase